MCFWKNWESLSEPAMRDAWRHVLKPKQNSIIRETSILKKLPRDLHPPSNYLGPSHTTGVCSSGALYGIYMPLSGRSPTAKTCLGDACSISCAQTIASTRRAHWKCSGPGKATIVTKFHSALDVPRGQRCVTSVRHFLKDTQDRDNTLYVI